MVINPLGKISPNVKCPLSPVICNISPVTSATATDPQPANSPTMHRSRISKTQKLKQIKNAKTHQNRKNVYSYANISDKLFDHKSPVHWEEGF